MFSVRSSQRPRLSERHNLAGLGIGYWDGIGALRSQWQVERTFRPEQSAEEVAHCIEGWHEAVRRTLTC